MTLRFTDQAALPDASLSAATQVLSSAALHRYQSADGALSETACLEQEFAQWQGSAYCLAVASGGQALQLALRAAGVTFGSPVLVEVGADLLIDLDDLRTKAKTSGAKTLLLSLMRGHMPDMTQLMALTDEFGITVIEDCAHTMGATWQGKKSGNFGAFGCFSCQTYKHLNAGEGGFLTTSDPKAAARAIVMSDSYMNYERHGAAPDASHFEAAKYDCPNMSARMDNLRSAILRPQLKALDQSIVAWNQRAAIVLEGLATLAPFVRLPQLEPGAFRVGSSIQPADTDP